MSNGVTVLDLLDEMEEILEVASSVPLTSRVIVEPAEMKDLIEKIKKSLPDDVQQARWISNERERILGEAKSEYKKIIMEAKKEADRLVEESVILRRARNIATEIYAAADDYSEEMTLKTYDYMESSMRNLEERITEMDDKYRETMNNYQQAMDEFNRNMMDHMTGCFDSINNIIEKDREEVIKLSEDVSTRSKPVHRISVDFDGE